MSKRIGRALSFLIMLSMVLSCLTGLTINVSAFQESETDDGDIRIYSDFLGDDLSYLNTTDWNLGSYYSSLSEIEGMVYANESVLSYSFLHNQADPQGPILAGASRVNNSNSDDDYVVMDMGWVLTSLEVQSIIATAEETVEIQYAEDDGRPVADYGSFDVNAYEWKTIDPDTIVNEKQEKCIGEWDAANGVRKTDRDILTSTVSKEDMPENARYFKVYLPRLTADRQNRWRVILSGFGGTYDPSSDPAPVPEDIVAEWPVDATITADNLTETSATVHWPEVVVTEGPADELSYQVAIDGVVQEGEISIDGGQCSMDVTGLKPGVEQTVTVSLIRYGMLFTPPEPLQGTVRANDPTMLTWADDAAITSSNVTQNTADISWPAIDADAQDITYRITVDGSSVDVTEALTYSLSRLMANTSYDITVTAEKNGVTVSTAPLEMTLTTIPVPEGQTSVILDTFNKDGVTDPEHNEDQRLLLFENIYDYGWDIGSNSAHPNDNTIFTQGHVVSEAEGIDSYTLTRKEATDYNKNAYIVYEIPNADMSSFEVSFIMMMGEGKIPVNATFEVSEDNVNYEQITTTIKQGENPDVEGEYKRWTYTGFNADRIPKTTDAEGNVTEYKKIKYLRINFPMPVSSTKCQSVQLEMVKINQNNRLNGWGADATITTKEVTDTSITLEWPAFQSDEDFEYMFSNEGIWVQNISKDQTSITIEGLDSNTEYEYAVAVVKKNSDDPAAPEADLASQLLQSERIRTDGSPYVLVDKFKFSDSHLTDGSDGVGESHWTRTWKGELAPAWDADWKAIQRGGSNGQGKTPFSVEYYLEVGLTDFSVDFVYGNVGGTPTDSTFEISSDGVTWTPIAVTKTGNPPSGWNYSVINFSPQNPEDIPRGTKYLRIIYGTSTDSSNRCFGIKLQQVQITKYDVMLDDADTFDLNQYLSNGETTDAIMSSFSLPDSYMGYPLEWRTSDPDVISLDGQVNAEVFDGYYKDVILTAGFRHNENEEEVAYSIEIPVRVAKNTSTWTDEQYIDYDFSVYPDSASITAPQDPNEIFKSINLPESLEGGSTFSWSVSDPEHATIQTIGKQTYVNFTFDYDREITLDIILTATKGSVTKEMRYPITLIKIYADNIAGTQAIMNASSNTDIKEDAADKDLSDYWESAADDATPYLEYDFMKPTLMNAVMLAEYGDAVASYKIEVSDNGREWEEVASGTTLGDRQKNVIQFAQVSTRYIRATFTPNPGETVKIASFEVYNAALTDEQIFAEVFNAISIPRRTTSDIELPTEGERGAIITWASSNESVLDTDGTVNRQSRDVTVTLTATAELPSGSIDSYDYTVTVAKESSSGSGGGGTGGSGSGGYTGGGGMPYVPTTDGEEPVTPEENTDETTEQIFADVPASHWASLYINNLYEKGIVNGSGDGLFQPDNNITREEFVKMLLLGMGVEISSESVPFADVDTNEWYAPYVATAYQLGIINGIDDENFGIGQLISRQDMAVMADRILQNVGIVSSDSEMIQYTDNDQIAGYAVEAVQNLADLNVMNGDTDNRFNPEANATRAESAKIVSILNSMLN